MISIDWDQVPLGKKADLVIAAELGVGVDIVRAARRARGIKTYSEWLKGTKQSPKEKAKEIAVEKFTAKDYVGEVSCLRCDKIFSSRDRRSERFCHQCRSNHFVEWDTWGQ